MPKFVKFVYFSCNLFDKKPKNGVEIYAKRKNTRKTALLTQSCSLRSVTRPPTYRRSLISSLQGVVNALFNGQLVPQILFKNETLPNEKTPSKGCFFVWRREEDLNLRIRSRITRFPIVLLKPLRHLCIVGVRSTPIYITVFF